MNTEHLKYIVKVFETGSINKAAEELYLAQATLSNIINHVEKDLGYKLFMRTNKGVKPTTEGLRFVKQAGEIMDSLKLMYSPGDRAAVDDSFAISCCPSSFLSKTSFQFMKAVPNQRGNDIFMERSVNDCMQDIIKFKSRLALLPLTSSQASKCVQTARQNRLAFLRIVEDVEVKIIMSTDHPLAKQSSVDYRDIEGYPFVAYVESDLNTILDICGSANSHRVLYVNSRASFNDALNEGGFLSAAMAFHPDAASEIKCVCLPLTNYFDSCSIYLCTINGYDLNPREKSYIEFLQSRYKKLFTQANSAL